MSKTTERLQNLAKNVILPELNLNNPQVSDAYDLTQSDIATDLLAKNLKDILPEAITADTQEQLVLTLTACLAQDFAYLRRYNHKVANSYKSQTSEALLSNEPDKLCDAIAEVHCGFVAACTMG
jgi:hypothetical protein